MPGFDHLVLRTPRLLLRPMSTDDAPALFAVFSDPAVMRYRSLPPWTALEQARAAIDRDLLAMARAEQLRLGIVLASEGLLIGTCTLFRLDEQSRRAEIGYALGSHAWGRGFMHEALTALLRHGFETLGLNRIEADIDPGNAASARSLERLGFQREGRLRERWIVNGEVSDAVMYGLLRADWARRDHLAGDVGSPFPATRGAP
ncbi:GNAT family N-acetyltransferase [Aquincola sp. S2]|uniref:GNAT family N-acetyltransferase n=1 Tax=Pseudaquabacterium terrae TaxID=2732868 RepID=A0ABX2ETF9_9BURK|nr:GNAT family N-acetyltransferase [Aquabacterium terrae]NRF71785.1 GNAT family N-acetyltransferase [Aquabacterium terrae]